ncbi:class I SAM-dependent methyltransferase [Helicobacter sp.]|uniref:class I SAM-dependent methyltransferase n=1 Tax=Helicobacter sp. TaxID=218 RepID=UPI00345B65BA
MKSIIDIGCGVGTWLKAWQDIKPNIRIFGIDGNDVDERLFYISQKDYYKRVDLRKNADEVFKIVCQDSGAKYEAKPFDLAESLEVAEHLEAQYAKNFIDLLTKFSDIVLFSAAIPYQGGTDHFNEQPPKYWADLFSEFGYVCFDIRKNFWNNEKICFWYRQNLLLFVHQTKVHLLENKGLIPEEPLYIAHPKYMEIYFQKCQEKCQENPIRLYWRHPTRFMRDLVRFVKGV